VIKISTPVNKPPADIYISYDACSSVSPSHDMAQFTRIPCSSRSLSTTPGSLFAAAK